MAIKSPKNKGSSGELEAAVLLTAMAMRGGYSLTLERNLEQVRHGGADLNGMPDTEIEVKRQETLSISTWWDQVLKAADNSGKVPVLMWRQNRKKWLFKVRSHVAFYPPHGGPGTTKIIDFRMNEYQFELWLHEHLCHRMEQRL